MVEHLKIASKQDVIMGFNEWKELRIASKNSFEDKNSKELSSLLSLRHVGCFSFSWRLYAISTLLQTYFDLKLNQMIILLIMR